MKYLSGIALASKVGVHPFDRVRWLPRKPIAHFSQLSLELQVLQNSCPKMVNLSSSNLYSLQYIITRDYKVKLMSKIY